jgi:hypothetical protein
MDVQLSDSLCCLLSVVPSAKTRESLQKAANIYINLEASNVTDTRPERRGDGRSIMRGCGRNFEACRHHIFLSA